MTAIDLKGAALICLQLSEKGAAQKLNCRNDQTIVDQSRLRSAIIKWRGTERESDSGREVHDQIEAKRLNIIRASADGPELAQSGVERTNSLVAFNIYDIAELEKLAGVSLKEAKTMDGPHKVQQDGQGEHVRKSRQNRGGGRDR